MGKKIKIIIIILAVAIIAGIVGFALWRILNANPIYTQYQVAASNERTDSQSAAFERFGDGFIRYSRDGVAYYNSDNVAQWNTSYQMSAPKLVTRGDCAAVAAIGESKIYVFNKSGLISSVDTVLPILAVSVSKQGQVAVLLEDSTSDVIDMFDAVGDKVYRIKATIDGTGTPTAISISDDGVKLMVAYTSIVDNEISTSVAFYNFGEVGQNVSERLVGGYEQYGRSIIPATEFINSNTAVAFGTDIMSIYSVGQYPKLIADIPVENEIQSVFFSENYVGVLFVNGTSEFPYNAYIYDLNGNVVATLPLSERYRKYYIIGKNVFMYDDNTAILMAFDGTVRMNYTFESNIDSIIPTAADDTYIYINSRKIQKIKFQ